MTWTAWLAALAPLAFLSASLAPLWRIPVRTSSLVAGWFSLSVAGLILALVLCGGAASTPTLGAPGLGLAIRVDALTGTVDALVAFIGLIVVAYSHNYLAGDPRQARFIRQLCLTLGLLQGLVLAGNLVQLVACWIGASLCVNRLLLFRGERQAAVLAARKRFLVSRLAEVCLVAAAVLLWRQAGSSDIGSVLDAARQGAGLQWAWAAALLAAAAIFSSAQIPFHGWILEVMETPTPVSALLHAGVVNAGGFLVLRFADVVAPHAPASNLLTVAGAASALFGSLVMLTQTSVKVSLAYSTIAQMGFMLLECGLGAYSVALLHIVAHAFYKAYAFLSAGGAAQGAKPSATEAGAPAARVLAAPAIVLMFAAAATAAGLDPMKQPGGFVLSSVLLLGLVRLWLQQGGPGGLFAALGVSGVAAAGYVAAQAVFTALGAQLRWPTASPNPASAVIAVSVVALMTGLVCLQLSAPGQARSPAWARVYALVANGFHLNTVANRWVLRFWPAAPSASTQTGATS